MPLDKEEVLKALKKLRENARPRRFKQSIELVVNLRDIDLKKPENRIDLRVELPHEPGKKEICVLASGETALTARKLGVDVLDRSEIEALAGDKRAQRRLAKKYDVFLSEATLMPLIGRILGPILGPRGKMPTPIPPRADIAGEVKRYEKTVRLTAKKQPVIHCKVGTEDMQDEAIADNILAILSKLEEALPSSARNIASIYVKETMSPAVRVM